MTDLISGPGTGQSNAVSSDAETEAQPPSSDTPAMEWAPMEPAPKKRRLGLWIGLSAGVLAVAAGAASLMLIAPGTTVAGVSVGFMTPGMAAEAVSSRVASTEVQLTGAGEGTRLDGADLGAGVDAAALIDQAFADRPMWNLGSWMGEPITADVTLDPETADSALRAAVPSSYTPATDATVVFDPTAQAYTATPAEPGTGVSVDDLAAAFTDAVTAGETSFDYSAEPAEVPALITDRKAAAAVEKLNGMVAEAGFYVGDERTVPVAPEVVASWLTIDAVEGELMISADPAKIQPAVDALPGQVNRDTVNATNIVDSGGEVLKALTEGLEGRVLGDTSKTAADFAKELGGGDATFALPVTATPFESTSLFRRVEVDLSEQRTYLYENEKLVKSWAVSTGTNGTPTDKGRFRVYAQLRTQDMRGSNADGSKYVTKGVPYITYYNGDEALHGTYWHSNFGTPMSHGCVNMSIDAARYVWEFATKGTEVWVHD
ncbi:L,D-transpeptidase [Microbacterium sp. NPDC055521]